MFFPQILSTKPQSCSSFSFGYTPFPTQRDRLVYKASTVVSPQLLNACKTQRKGNLQSLRRVATPVFQTAEKKPPQSKVYLCRSLLQPSFCFYFIRKICFYHLTILLTWVYRDKHRHFYENNFSKPGAHPQFKKNQELIYTFDTLKLLVVSI